MCDSKEDWELIYNEQKNDHTLVNTQKIVLLPGTPIFFDTDFIFKVTNLEFAFETTRCMRTGISVNLININTCSAIFIRLVNLTDSIITTEPSLNLGKISIYFFA